MSTASNQTMAAGLRDAILVERTGIGDGPTAVAIKDSIDVAGLPTRMGSRLFADAPPTAFHAEVVERLIAAGRWRIVGKANMHELAFGVTGVNPWSGTPVNPRWPDRIPGGSSSGSAVAIAAGIAGMALGTDTGGSIRMPAACCGIVGFKPSHGLVSRAGVHPAHSSLDSVGPFARSVAMVERAMADIAPPFAVLPVRDAARAVVIAPAVDPDIAETIAKALDRSGLDLQPGRLDGMDEASDAGLVVIGHENWGAFGRYADDPRLGEDVRARLRAGREQGPEALGRAEAVRATFARAVDTVLADADVIALPTLPVAPPTLEEARDARAAVPLTRLVRPFNLSGHPAISLPLVTREGLPAALQLVGRRGDDAMLCAVARSVSGRLGIEEIET